MPQLSLYLDDVTMNLLRSDARRAGKSMSRYAADLIRGHSAAMGWPAGYWDSVYGCLGDDDLASVDDDLHPELDDSCDWFD